MSISRITTAMIESISMTSARIFNLFTDFQVTVRMSSFQSAAFRISAVVMPFLGAADVAALQVD